MTAPDSHVMEPPETTTHAGERPFVVPSAGFTAERVGRALREPDHWRQLIKFGMVGASGFLINAAVFAFALHVLGVHYLLANVLAFCVAVGNNFFWNRTWTFRHDRADRHVAFQAVRFLSVACIALALSSAILWVLVELGGLNEQVAQLIAVALVTPFSFLANKLWSFR